MPLGEYPDEKRRLRRCIRYETEKSGSTTVEQLVLKTPTQPPFTGHFYSDTTEETVRFQEGILRRRFQLTVIITDYCDCINTITDCEPYEFTGYIVNHS